MMQLGIELMGLGLLGVFSTLILFMVVIKVLTGLFPYKAPEE